MGLLALRGGLVVTMDESRRLLPDGCVVVEDGHIAAVGPAAEVAVPAVAETIDTRGHAVLPGFVNAHAHTAQILLRGGPSHGRDLYDWLVNVLYPGLDVYEPEDIRVATRLAAIEALRSGTTTIVDNAEVGHGDYERAARAAIEVYDAIGMRVVYARMFTDHETAAYESLASATAALDPRVRHASPFEPTDRALADLERLMRTFDGASAGRIEVWPAPSIPLLVSPRGLAAARELARARNGMWTLHVAETRHERRVHGLSPVAYLESSGALGPELLAAHCVDVDDDDLDLLARRDVKVSVQPTSNAHLASGVAPVREMLARELTLGVGTDDANCNDQVNVVAELRLLGHLQALRAEDAAAVQPETLLELATLGGARAIGRAADLGSIEVGKRADLIALDLNRPQLVPAANVAAAIVYQAYGDEVDTVVVDGRIVLREGRFASLPPADERATLAEARERAAAIVRRARLRA